MVFDPERGCVYGRNWQDVAPRQTLISLRLEIERESWSQASETPKHAPLQSNLERIYTDKLNGRTVSELPRAEHPVFPGFTPYGLVNRDTSEILAVL